MLYTGKFPAVVMGKCDPVPSHGDLRSPKIDIKSEKGRVTQKRMYRVAGVHVERNITSTGRGQCANLSIVAMC